MFFGKTSSAKSVSTRKHRCLFQPHCFAHSVIFHQLKAAVLLQIFGEQGLTDTGSDLNAAAQNPLRYRATQVGEWLRKLAEPA